MEATQQICAIVLRQLGKKVSPKCDRTVKTNGEHVGLSFTKGGVQLSDATVEQLKRMLDVMPKGKKQMQRLLGTIVQAMTAFEFDNSNIDPSIDSRAVSVHSKGQIDDRRDDHEGGQLEASIDKPRQFVHR